MSETRTYEVGMSVEALASAWARTESAPPGAVVVVDNEIAGRLRGGTPWRLGGDDALMMAMIVRPNVNPMHEALLWLVASLAAAEALTDVTGSNHDVRWPDTITDADTIADADTEATRCSVNVLVQLGPGRIEHAILAARVVLHGLDVDVSDVVDALRSRLSAAVQLLESDRLALVDAYTDRCSTMGNRVHALLFPRGEARGKATAVDPDGFLVLESATGMLERLPPTSLRSLTNIPD